MDTSRCSNLLNFMQRAHDQIIHDVALQNIPMLFAIDRAGLVGADGAHILEILMFHLYDVYQIRSLCIQLMRWN